MRRFAPVTEAKTCDNPVCERVAPISEPEEAYTSQTVVTYDGSDLAFTYCSNRCVNADYERSSKAAEDQSHYWAHIQATYEDQERTLGAHLAAFIEDGVRAAAAFAASSGSDPQVGRWAAIGDPFLDDDETEEVLRDVVVAQAMEWTERGADPTDLVRLLVATGNLRAWMQAHPTE